MSPELQILLNYVQLAIMLFFITFFVGIFVQYFRTKSIQPRKMLSFKKGGLFEHYKVVAAIIFGLMIIHGVFDMSPFEPGIVAFIVDLVLTYVPLVIFLVFFFVFTLYLVFYLYARLKRLENPSDFLQQKSHLIIHVAFFAAVILATIAIIFLLLNEAMAL